MHKKLNYNINILNKNCITTWLYPKSTDLFYWANYNLFTCGLAEI